MLDKTNSPGGRIRIRRYRFSAEYNASDNTNAPEIPFVFPELAFNSKFRLKTAQRLKRAVFVSDEAKSGEILVVVFRAFLTKYGAKKRLLRLFILMRMRPMYRSYLFYAVSTLRGYRQCRNHGNRSTELGGMKRRCQSLIPIEGILPFQ